MALMDPTSSVGRRLGHCREEDGHSALASKIQCPGAYGTMYRPTKTIYQDVQKLPPIQRRALFGEPAEYQQ